MHHNRLRDPLETRREITLIVTIATGSILRGFRQFHGVIVPPDSLMAKSIPGRCVHCLHEVDAITDDHLFPRSWYPTTTPQNLEKWKFPACGRCNREYGKVTSSDHSAAARNAASRARTRDGCSVPSLGDCPCGAAGGTENHSVV